MSVTKSPTILVINCGSSSIKFALLAQESFSEICHGLIENIGNQDARLRGNFLDNQYQQTITASNHQQAMSALLEFLRRHIDCENVQCVAHRIVHGGELFSSPVILNNDNLAELESLSTLAPLHNPANLVGVKAAQTSFSQVPHIAVFDTSFHQSMPAKAYLYGLPYEYYSKHKIRRYGFHGASHFYVSRAATDFLGQAGTDSQLISVHLGNGCSAAAIKNGQSVDTSMGFTPLEGLMMGTRSGDIDPGVIIHLATQLNLSIAEISELLNKQSGLKGLSQQSNDCRTLEKLAKNGDKQCQLALEVFCYRVAKNIASLTVALTRLDAIIFTGGIGENSVFVRQQVVKNLAILGLEIDDNRNDQVADQSIYNIAKTSSKPCLVIRTNEERVMAELAHALVKDKE